MFFMSKKPTYEDLANKVAELERQVEKYRSEAVKYRTLFDSFPHGITVTDENGGILETNEAAEKMLDVCKEEHEIRVIDGREWRIVRPDGSDMPSDEWASVVALKEKRPVTNCEMGMIKSEGEVRWISVTAAPLPVEGHGVVVTYNDISDKKQVEKELEEKEKRFRGFFENAGFYGYIVSPEGNILDVNTTAIETLGYSRDELVGAPMSALYAEECLDEAKRLFQEWKVTGRLRNAELVVKTKNGERRDIMLNVDSCRDDSGRIVHSTSIQVDITDRKLTQKHLEKYRNIVSSTKDAIAFLDDNYRYSIVNDSYEIFSGVKRETFIGLTVTEYLGKQVFETFVKPNFDRCLRGEVVNYQEWFDYPTLGRRFVDVAYYPYRNNEGRISGVIANTRDITEQKRTQDALAKSEARLNLALEAVSDAIWDWRVDTGEVYLNPGWYEMLGFEPYELAQEYDTWKNLIHPQDQPGAEKTIRRHLEVEKPFTMEFRMRTKDGTWKWILDRGKTVERDASGNAVRMIGTHVDISRQKAAEAEIVASENALRKSERELSLTLDATTDGIWTWDFTKNELIFSPKWYKMLGYQPDEFPADYEHWRDLIHPDDRDGAIAVAERYLESKPDLYENEFHLRAKDGCYRWIHTRARVVERDANGDAVFMIGNHDDITDRKTAEEKLKKHVVLLENLNRIDKIIRTGTDAEQVMGQLLETVQDIFETDRAWLLYPCDPEAASWKVPVERTRPDFPVAFERNMECPMTEGVAQGMRELLTTDEPCFGTYRPGEFEYDPYDKIGIRSFLITAVHPKVGKPWEFGLHQCARERVWTDREVSLFKKIGNRIGDALSIHLSLRELRKSEQKFRRLVESSSDLIWETDESGKYTYASPQVESILGFRPDEIIGKTPFELMPPGEARRIRKIFDQAVEEREHIVQLETVNLHKNGREVVLETSAVPVIAEAGFFKGYQGIDRDVTERKRTQDALEESEAKYRSIMESMDESTYICSSDFRIEYMNPAMIEKIGRDTTGEKCYQAIHHLEKPCPWCEHEKVMKGELIKKELVKPEGDEAYYISHSPIFHTNGSVSKLSVYRDITEIKKLESRIQQAQKMESIGNLAGGIAHDFNNILYPIIGMAELLLEDLPPRSEVHDNAQEILRAGMRGSDLVKQILAFSRKSEHKLIPVRLQRIAKEVLKLSRATIPSDIEIVEDIQKDCGLLMGDPTQIHQVLMNVVTNAYHAMGPEGGKITMRLKDTVLGADDSSDGLPAPGRYARLSVSDTGHGMSADLLTKIFEPYFTTKERGKGTGLGLAVAYGIVKEHKGDIKVSSEPGRGTTFDIYLPLMDRPIDKEEKPSAGKYETGTERILLVDDEPAAARLEKLMLERLGYEVTSRLSSLEALEAFKAHPRAFDLVLSDMTMPGMTGDRLARELMAIRPEIPVILCTGFSERISEEKAEALGIKGFLMKPVLKSALARMVRKVLDEFKSEGGK